MPTALVIGASRGVGLGLVHELVAKGYDVIAAARKPDGLSLGEGVRLLQLDITNEESVRKAAAEVESLDTIILNAAIGDQEQLLTTSTARLSEYMESNVIGPHRVVLAFLDALRKGKAKQIVLISSQSGSMTRQINATRGFCGPYAVSKAAVNMMAIQLHNELQEEGFTVVPIHPGWVATEMGSIAGSGGMPVEKSAAGIVEVIGGLDPTKSAHFVNFANEELPW